MTANTDNKNNLFLFFGEDRYSMSEKLKLWQTEFIRKHGDTNLETIDGKDLNTAEFNTNIESLPFLAEKRLIIIKDFLAKGSSDNQKKVAEALENATDTCILIFIENEAPDRRTSLFQKISKIGKLVEFPELSPIKVTNWILEQATTRNIKISRLTATYLTEYCGNDLWTINNELEKLKQFSNGADITNQMIEELCIPSISSSIFKLTDSIAAKNHKEALKILKILVDSDEELTKIFFMIVRHFRLLIQICEMLNKNETPITIARHLQQKPFVIQTLSRQCKNFTLESLAKIYGKLLQIDTDFKTGVIKTFRGDDKEFQLAIEKFIIDCTSL